MIEFDDLIEKFVRSANQHKVQMILVGGAAVNFHGYQRHSADVDFWIKLSEKNLDRLQNALGSIGFDYRDTPKKVRKGLQNISVKISPIVEVEIITRFSLNKSFEEAYEDAVIRKINDVELRVINLDDLIASKVKSGRNKDLLDIEKLREIHDREE